MTDIERMVGAGEDLSKLSIEELKNRIQDFAVVAASGRTPKEREQEAQQNLKRAEDTIGRERKILQDARTPKKFPDGSKINPEQALKVQVEFTVKAVMHELAVSKDKAVEPLVQAWVGKEFAE